MKQLYTPGKSVHIRLSRYFLIFVFSFLSFGHLDAQAPLKIRYQAIIRDNHNQLLPKSRIGLRVSILQGSVNGTPVFVETHNRFTNENGLLSIVIGAGDVVSGDLGSVDWRNGPYYLKTEIDPDGGTNYSIKGVSEFMSIPYALFAENAANAFSGDYNDLINTPDLSVFLTQETDPVFTTSVAGGITEADTARWNRKPDSLDEKDPVFGVSVAGGITEQDTSYWNHKLDAEVDGSVTNEIQTISRHGLTVTLSNNGGSYTDSVNVYTAGKDIDITDNTISLRTYKVGDPAFGGIVFWVDGSGRHGLVCTKEDLSTGMRWYAGTYGNTRALGDGPYAGFMNTSVIISSQVAIGDDGGDYAALLCSKLVVKDGDKSYGDWYLPSKEELMLMHKALEAINTTAVSSKGAACESSYYWSSTEYDQEQAWKMNLVTGDVVHYYKTYAARVRAIRKF
jgi:hypothetical protein